MSRHDIPVLTPRQHEILTLMARGLTTPEIAGELVLGRDTVRTHQQGIYRTLDVHTAPAAVAAGYRVGLLDDHAVR
ncbi:helix-turn-helix domain-containing protein [Streptacidiphilus pinicola]|nr:helix-turn-helix transcriptional regulator [Streptacidiphilus pinicola]